MLELFFSLLFSYLSISLGAETEPLPTAQARSSRAQALFGANYPRLQRLKQKYDPNMIFDKWFVIQPSDA